MLDLLMWIGCSAEIIQSPLKIEWRYAVVLVLIAIEIICVQTNDLWHWLIEVALVWRRMQTF